MFKLLNTDIKASAFIVLISALLFIPFIGNMPLFDWDEINFAECAREMLVTNNYSNVQLYYQPFWEKPPLFIWLQAMSMNVFGINEFAARFPNAICGIVTLLVLYFTGKKINDNKFGLVWAFVYAATLLPQLFFKSGIIDPWFNLFIYIAVYYLILHTNNPVGKFAYKTAILSGIFLGLALLTKGPAALIIVGLTLVVFFVLYRFKKISELKFIAAFFASFFIVGLSWFTIEYLKGNEHIIKEFIDYQIRLLNTEDSGHGGPFIYHFVVLLIGCFPASLLFIVSHKRSLSDTSFQKHTKLWMLSLFWVVLILFSFVVKTKIVHYSSLCYFPLTYLATYTILKLQSNAFAWKRWLNISFIIITSLLGILFITIAFIEQLKPYIIKSNLIDDAFAVENLKANVHWNGFEWLIGVVFLIAILYCLMKINKGHKKMIYGIFLTTLITTNALLLHIAPKIEQYSQHAAIEFYKACAKHHFLVETISFKSYASLFYSELSHDISSNKNCNEYITAKKNDLEKEGIDATRKYPLFYMQWLAEKAEHQTICLVAKCTDEDLPQRYPNFTELYRKNGFIFLLKKTH